MQINDSNENGKINLRIIILECCFDSFDAPRKIRVLFAVAIIGFSVSQVSCYGTYARL
jgi:hypothetical protein